MPLIGTEFSDSLAGRTAVIASRISLDARKVNEILKESSRTVEIILILPAGNHEWGDAVEFSPKVTNRSEFTGVSIGVGAPAAVLGA